jgi:hypothetical protein
MPHGSTLAARRSGARDLLSEVQLAKLRKRSLWHGLWMIAHAWGVILGAIALVGGPIRSPSLWLSC